MTKRKKTYYGVFGNPNISKYPKQAEFIYNILEAYIFEFLDSNPPEETKELLESFLGICEREAKDIFKRFIKEQEKNGN